MPALSAVKLISTLVKHARHHPAGAATTQPRTTMLHIRTGMYPYANKRKRHEAVLISFFFRFRPGMVKCFLYLPRADKLLKDVMVEIWWTFQCEKWHIAVWKLGGNSHTISSKSSSEMDRYLFNSRCSQSSRKSPGKRRRRTCESVMVIFAHPLADEKDGEMTEQTLSVQNYLGTGSTRAASDCVPFRFHVCLWSSQNLPRPNIMWFYGSTCCLISNDTSRFY